MVNYGVSKGCETCKRRRKKCDETRPHCKACIRTKRICPGYKEESDLVFRSYKPTDGTIFPSGPVAFEDVAFPSAELDARLETYALDAFFSDYCVPSKDRTVSRGYLDGLQELVIEAGPSSDLARTARMVAFAGLGRRWKRPALIERGKSLYPVLLRSFSKTIADHDESNSFEALMTVVLLGLYEMICGTESDPGHHSAHARGVTAILHMDDNPFELLTMGNHLKLANPVLLRKDAADGGRRQVNSYVGLFRAPLANNDAMSMDSVADASWQLIVKAEKMLYNVNTTIEDLRILFYEAKELDRLYSRWPDTQPREWRPKILGRMGEDESEASKHPLCWPGPVESYFDLYVATVWNTSRKGRILVLELLYRLGERFDDMETVKRAKADATLIGAGILSALPYFLTADASAFVPGQGNGPGAADKTIQPGQSVGGLLILHPLHIASTFTSVDEPLRKHMVQCLEWVGEHLGIGQATLLARNPQNVPRQFLRDAHILVWAGMMIQPC